MSLKITANGANYDLSWEEIRIVCITTPCPDIADLEAEQYEIQIADNELGPFQTYKTVDARQKSIRAWLLSNLPLKARPLVQAKIDAIGLVEVGLPAWWSR